ncbi:MAG TPA: hypothetical protein VN040_06820 [Pseudosphingobacterium sp.]|nr:hypothetical protein [Pseudosphingobacterium sp.]
MNFIVISHDPFRLSMREHYYMNSFARDGYKVQYWCVQDVLLYATKAPHGEKDVDYDDIIHFSSYKSFMQALRKLESNTVFCLEVWFNKDTFEIFRIINQKNALYFSIDYYKNQPRIASNKEKALTSILQLDLVKLVKAVWRRVNVAIFRIHCLMAQVYDVPVVFIPGKVAENRYSTKSKKVISINHFDLEHFRNSTVELAQTKDKYLLFIDIYLPYHPDVQRLGCQSVNPESYFASLNKLFSQLEQATGLKVVVAAHPKARYQNEFGDRLCISGQTSSLVRNAELVLTHHSTALNFAVLAKKKICLLSSSEFKNANHKNYILRNIYEVMKGYQKELNCSMVCFDSLISLSEIKDVDEGAYDRFIQEFLLSKQEISNYQIIRNELEKIKK